MSALVIITMKRLIFAVYASIFVFSRISGAGKGND